MKTKYKCKKCGSTNSEFTNEYIQEDEDCNSPIWKCKDCGMKDNLYGENWEWIWIEEEGESKIENSGMPKKKQMYLVMVQFKGTNVWDLITTIDDKIYIRAESEGCPEFFLEEKDIYKIEKNKENIKG